jgi:hypothetical protein
MRRFKIKSITLLIALLGAFTFMSCDEDDMMDEPDDPTGMFMASDQMVNNGTITISSVTMSDKGWVVVHRDDNGAPMVPDIISTPKQVPAGTSENVTVELEETVLEGETIWIMLHTDNGEIGEYEFDGSNGLDGPILDEDGNVVTSPIMVTVAPMGSFEAEDQTISQNTVVVNSVSLNKNGWVVIHKDNGSGGPQVPDIVSEPKFVEAGTQSNVEVQIKDGTSLSDGESLWIMLHTDNGTIGEYEFDGSSGFDGPIIDDQGNVVTSPIEIYAPGIIANDQPVVNREVVINEVDAATDGWIVIHNDNGSGDITLPQIIGKTAVDAGVNSNVVIELADTVNISSGQKLFPMLHIDADPSGEYNFPGVDAPEVFGFEDNNIIVTSISVQ